MITKNPKGGAAISVIVSVVLVVVFTVVAGPGAGYGIGCAVGLFCGGGGGGGGGGAPATVQNNDPCTSEANACGMTNMGFYVGDDNTGTATCNATPPPNSSCPPPTIAQGGGFYATPSTVGTGGQATLHWNASNATGCSVSGDNGFSYSGDTSGSISTGALSQTTLFTLTCQNGAGGSSTSASVRVIVDPQYKEI